MKNLEKTLYILGIILVIAGTIYGIVDDASKKNKYGETRYEFVITDKYEDIGSTFHLVGGRASEQKYHIEYKYRLTNRPDNDRNLVWECSETTVSGSTYRKMYIGQTMYNDSPFLPYVY